MEDAPSQQAMAEEFAAAADEAGAEEATEDKAAFPVFGSMWRLRNRRLAEEFAAAADEAGADEAEADKAAVVVSRESAWRRPVFGSMWVRHAEHGLVRRSARIAARNNQP